MEGAQQAEGGNTHAFSHIQGKTQIPTLLQRQHQLTKTLSIISRGLLKKA